MAFPLSDKLTGFLTFIFQNIFSIAKYIYYFLKWLDAFDFYSLKLKEKTGVNKK